MEKKHFAMIVKALGTRYDSTRRDIETVARCGLGTLGISNYEQEILAKR